ncbi:tripartite tricarboxylate transporter TctB family protein [Oribacterium sp. NK2B42]|uniref:tripartite tricarboxylate transporter TctB family protein n=1 Tax=Oribacterium sp. NK2B42 TaxID=689781 RepID=UPI0003F79EEC|nr:tripartite tricarboxylate transporter TctB family protein [Oribacterium sp. NK2B42]
MFFKKYGDFVVGIFYAVLGIALIIGAKALPKSKVMEIGPDFMPTLVGAIILILAGILLVQTFAGFKANAAELEASGFKDTSDYKRVLGSLVSAIIYVNILKPVGFIVSTLVYLIIQIYILAPDNKRTKKDLIQYAIIDVVFTVVVYFLFRYGFKIVLPGGILAF